MRAAAPPRCPPADDAGPAAQDLRPRGPAGAGGRPRRRRRRGRRARRPRRAARRSALRLLLSRDARRSRRDATLPALDAKALRFGRLQPRRSTPKRRVTVRVPASTPAATYYVLACADGATRVRERRERNNCRALGRLVVVAAAPGPVPPPPGGNDPG